MLGEINRTIEVSQLIDEQPLSKLQMRVIILCGLVVLLDGYDIQTMALGVPSIAQSWGVSPSVFGVALSASLIGLMLGAGLLAPFGDKIGRIPLLAGGMALVGLASLFTVFATTPTDLAVWRLLTGLGLGASMPNGTALTSEYMPLKRRAALVTLMFCNLSIGAFAAGFSAPALIQRFGWHGIFIVGGVIPLLIAPLLWLLAPESLRFLAVHRPNDPKVARILSKLAPGREIYLKASDPAVRKGQSLSALFSTQFRARTAVIWGAFALNLFVLYMLISWIPTLLRHAGWSAGDASRGVGIINAGGVVGGLLLSWFVDHKRTVPAILSAYAAVVIALVLFTQLPSGAIWWSLLLVIGGGTAGTQMTLNALSAAIYPPCIRATGVGWATSIGRIGAALAPLLGSVLVARQFATTTVFGLLIIPVLACAIAISLLAMLMRSAETPAASLNAPITSELKGTT